MCNNITVFVPHFRQLRRSQMWASLLSFLALRWGKSLSGFHQRPVGKCTAFVLGLCSRKACRTELFIASALRDYTSRGAGDGTWVSFMLTSSCCALSPALHCLSQCSFSLCLCAAYVCTICDVRWAVWFSSCSPESWQISGKSWKCFHFIKKLRSWCSHHPSNCQTHPLCDRAVEWLSGQCDSDFL